MIIDPYAAPTIAERFGLWLSKWAFLLAIVASAALMLWAGCTTITGG